MVKQQRKVTKTPPTVFNFLSALIGPIITVITLRVITFVYNLDFDGPYMSLAIITFLISFTIFKEVNLQTLLQSGSFTSQTKNLLGGWLLLLGILLFLGYVTKSSEEFSRRAILTWFAITPLILLICYSLFRILVIKIFSYERFSRSVVIVGLTDLGRNLSIEIVAEKQLNLSFKGYFDDREPSRVKKTNREQLLGKLKDITNYIKKNKIDLIYITLPMVQEKRILKLLDELRDTTVSIYFAPDLFIFDLIQARIDDMNGIPVLAVCESPFYGITGLLKRSSDFLFASFILILISPIMLLIAIAILVTSPGPVIFKQKRYGLDSEEIKVYKFRTMRVMEDGEKVTQAHRGDPRITKLGAFLRRTSLDELPQFINVLQGRMSVVGPRPHAVAHNEEYRKLVKGYMVRHKVKPGITGWAQVNGLRGETDTVDKMKARIEYDLDYLRHWSIGLDSMIILRTVMVLFRDKNAY